MQKFTKLRKFGLAAMLTCTAFAIHPTLFAQTNDTIGTGTTATNVYGPCRVTNSASSTFSTKVINLYNQGELAVGGIVPGSVIHSVSWRKAGVNTLQNGYAVNIAVSLRDQITLSSYGTSVTSTTYIDNYIGNTFTAVGSQLFSSTANNLPADSSWVTINFTTPFTYTGGSLEILTNATVTAGTGIPSPASLNWRYTNSSVSTINPTMYTNSMTAYNNTVTANLSGYRPNVIFNYTPGPNCTGTPNAGIISMDTTRACAGMLAGHLKLTGASGEGGITVQWQKKATSDPAFVNVTSLSPFQLLNQSITETTQYRVNVTCSVSGITTTSPVFTMLPTPSVTPNYFVDFNFPASWIPTTITNCWEGRKGLMDYPVTFLTTGTSFAAGSWASDGWNNVGTLGSARLRINAVAYDWFLTPIIDLGTGNYQLDFDLGVFTFNAPGAGVMDADDNFNVVISTDGGATFSQANIIKEINASNTTFPIPNGVMHVMVPLTQYSGNIKLAFFGTGGALDPTPSSLAPDLMIDNVQINPLGTVLPVKMGLLEASINKSGHSALTWKTYSEEDNAGFIIQKSVDGKEFKNIAIVPSKAMNGNSKSTLTYNFIDAAQNDADVYYRIIQTDKNDAQTYSNVVKLFFGDDKKEAVSIFPNPAGDAININFSGMVNNTDRMTITDVAGHIVIKATTLSNQMKLDVSKLAAGIYFINITGNNGTSVHKIIKL